MVTGAAGFLGRHLAEALLTEGDVIGVDRIAPRTPGTAGRGRFDFVECDLRDAARVTEVCRRDRFDIIFHLAGVLALPAEEDPVAACQANVQGTLHLLEAARRAGIGRVVFASSIAVYGQVGGRITEDAPLRPRLMYGVTKVAGEALGGYYTTRHGLDFRALRLPSVLGPGRGGESLTGNYSRLVEAAATGRPFEVPLPPEVALPLVYVKDSVAALRALGAAPRERLRRTAYHLNGFAPPLTLGALADAVRRRLPGTALTFRPDPAVEARVRDLAGLELDDAAARDDWGWTPRFDADLMVADFLASRATAC